MNKLNSREKILLGALVALILGSFVPNAVAAVAQKAELLSSRAMHQRKTRSVGPCTVEPS